MNNTEGKTSKKQKEQPGVLRKECKRILKSRNNLKDKNRKKANIIKKTKDQVIEVRKSRNHWQRKTEELKREVKSLSVKLEQYVDNEIKYNNEIATLREELKKNS